MFLCSRLCCTHSSFHLPSGRVQRKLIFTVLLNLYTNKMSYYAVAKGRNVGIYRSWGECKAQVDKYSAPVFKKFGSKSEAEQFIQQRSSTPSKSYSYSSSGSSSSCSSSSKGLTSTRNYSSYAYGSSSSSPPSYSCSTSSTKRSVSTRNDSSDDDEPAQWKKSKSDQDDFKVDSNGFVEVYTDGACSGNGRGNAKAGVGVWFSANNKFNVSQPVQNGRATNNYAEINAITMAANQAKRAGIKKLKINTDSQFVISCINQWMPSWKKRDWKTAHGKPVINKQELIEMEKALDSLDVAWNHVRGHVGVHGNEMADQLARAGAERYRD